MILLPAKIISLELPCARKTENRKRRSLKGILRRARTGRCIVREQTNFEILENPLYIVHLTEEDLEKMIRDRKLIEEIYNETLNTRKCG